MRQRIWAVGRWVAAATVVGWAVFDVFTVGFTATAPAAVACCALAAWPHLQNLLPMWITMVVAAVSWAATIGYGGSTANRAGVWWVVETGALLAVVFLGARAARTWTDTAAVIVLVSAVGISPLRLGLHLEPPSATDELAILCLLWTIVAVAAAAAGRFVRRQRRERERAISEARHTQRLSLARDLHDFVAHDVTGIVVQAQAAQLAGEKDPAQAVAALARIEQAGLQALTSLDRTVVLLREHTDRLRDTGDGFADIVVLTRRFEATSGAKARLNIDYEGPDRSIPEPISALAHRIATEALTNVHTHAPGASDVSVSLRRMPTALAVDIVNDLPRERTGEPRPRAASGHGLPGLTEHVASVGGTLDAGPTDTKEWRVSAVLPL